MCTCVYVYCSLRIVHCSGIIDCMCMCVNDIVLSSCIIQYSMYILHHPKACMFSQFIMANLFKIIVCDCIAAGDTANNLGVAMDELMRHQPTLRSNVIKALITVRTSLLPLSLLSPSPPPPPPPSLSLFPPPPFLH